MLERARRAKAAAPPIPMEAAPMAAARAAPAVAVAAPASATEGLATAVARAVPAVPAAVAVVAVPVDPLRAAGWATLPLPPGARSAVARALDLAARLLDDRPAAALGEVAIAGDVLVAHWPTRSQRRLLPHRAAAGGNDAATAALRDARRHLAALAADLVGADEASVLAASTTDAFVYGPGQGCAAHRDAGVVTFVVANNDGFEVKQNGVWTRAHGGAENCVVIAGKKARARGFDADAIEHRVVPSAAGRTSITFDLHPTPERAARGAALSNQRLYFEMRINTRESCTWVWVAK